mgnify:CR=1 FL=1
MSEKYFDKVEIGGEIFHVKDSELNKAFNDHKNTTTTDEYGENLLDSQTMVEYGAFMQFADGKVIKTSNNYTENYKKCDNNWKCNC